MCNISDKNIYIERNLIVQQLFKGQERSPELFVLKLY